MRATANMQSDPAPAFQIPVAFRCLVAVRLELEVIHESRASCCAES